MRVKEVVEIGHLGSFATSQMARLQELQEGYRRQVSLNDFWSSLSQHFLDADELPASMSEGELQQAHIKPMSTEQVRPLCSVMRRWIRFAASAKYSVKGPRLQELANSCAQ
eukprot:TRINITY_DN63623_c0_g1_i1.p1 TRINITY_DN63623_c0_g1~~TRINITY_DN63623_c0_g1_i1.p1  ORF type:complete len:111 (-),score=15.31 TRINITY_DN63623_c0_g1_i1:97-429(-)